jgi:hypothetical protein
MNVWLGSNGAQHIDKSTAVKSRGIRGFHRVPSAKKKTAVPSLAL